MRTSLYALSLLLVATASQASDLAIGLSNKSVSLDFAGAIPSSALQFTMSGLHHVDEGNIAAAGVQVSQKIDRNVDAAVGAKGVAIFNDTKNASALALGGSVDVAVPMVQKLYIGAHAWVAPNVVSYGGATNYRDLGATASLRLMTNASVFLGYRYVRVSYENYSDRVIQDGVVGGIKLFF